MSIAAAADATVASTAPFTVATGFGADSVSTGAAAADAVSSAVLVTARANLAGVPVSVGTAVGAALGSCSIAVLADAAAVVAVVVNDLMPSLESVCVTDSPAAAGTGNASAYAKHAAAT